MTAIAALVEQHRHDDHRPEIAICQKGEMPITGRALLMTPRNSAPHRQPSTRPLPPMVLIPPITQAATTEFKTVGDVDIGDGEARDPQIAAEAGQRAGETEADELHFPGVNAGVVCRRRVAARGV